MNMTIANLSNFLKTFPKISLKTKTFPDLSKMDWKGFARESQGLEWRFAQPFQLSKGIYIGKKTFSEKQPQSKAIVGLEPCKKANNLLSSYSYLKLIVRKACKASVFPAVGLLQIKALKTSGRPVRPTSSHIVWSDIRNKLKALKGKTRIEDGAHTCQILPYITYRIFFPFLKITSKPDKPTTTNEQRLTISDIRKIDATLQADILSVN